MKALVFQIIIHFDTFLILHFVHEIAETSKFVESNNHSNDLNLLVATKDKPTDFKSAPLDNVSSSSGLFGSESATKTISTSYNPLIFGVTACKASSFNTPAPQSAASFSFG